MLRISQVVASYSDKFVVIADYRKASNKLGQAWDYVPIEVLALAYRPLMAKIEEQLGGRCEVKFYKLNYRVSPKKWCIAISNSPVVLDVQIF